MSDVTGPSPRPRRRAVRSVGPPVEDGVTSSPESASPPTAAGTPPRPGFFASAPVHEPVDVPAPPQSAWTGGTVESGSVATVSDGASTVTDPEPGAREADATGSATESSSEESGAATVSLVKAGATSAPRKRTRWSVRRIATVAAASVLVAASVVGAVASVVVNERVEQREERRTEYVQAARQAVLNLTTIRADSAKEDIDRILSVASGQFRSEFDGRVDPFLSIVQQAKVVSNGEVVEAAVQSDDEDSAQVLVAAKQTLTNAGQAEPQTRYYRFRVTVDRSDSGLTASKVEFVG